MRKVLLAGVAALALGLWGPSVEAAPEHGGQMIVTYKDDVSTLDPAIGYDWQNWSMIKSLFDGLMKALEYAEDLGREPEEGEVRIDTIFLLSDGAPTWCNWTVPDSRDPEDQAGDPETGVMHDNVPTLWFMSPYGSPPFRAIVEDVERLNLFRHAEVHCIGMGEADTGLLQQIAAATGGTSTTVKER